jgi:hypothetical protein
MWFMKASIQITSVAILIILITSIPVHIMHIRISLRHHRHVLNIKG